MKKKILFLGDGIYLKNLIKLYRKNIYDRFLIYHKTNLHKKSNFKKTFEINLLEMSRIYNIAKKLKIDHVITDQNDFAMGSYGFLCTKLKLKGIPFNICKRFSNKKNCREFLKKKKIFENNLPKFYLSHEKIPNYLKKKKFILKPRNMQGSRYVYKLNYKDLKEKVRYLNSLKIGYIIEDFIEGQDYAVESVVNESIISNLVISKKFKFTNSFIDKKIISRNYTNSKIENNIYELTKKILKALNIKNGLTHIEFRAHKNKIYIIEAACRGAGSGISNIIVPYLTGFDTDKFLYKSSVGLSYFYQKKKVEKKKVILEWLSNNNKINLNEGKLLYFFKKKIKKKIMDSSDRGSFYIKSIN